MEPENAPAPGGIDVRPAKPASASGKGDLDFLWNVSKLVTEDTRLADAKAGTIIVLASSLVAALYSTRLHVVMLSKWPWQWGVLQGLAAIAFGLLGAGVFLAVWAIKPRLWAAHSKGFIYWKSIRGFDSAAEFWRAFRELDDESLVDHLAQRLYLLAGVCERKYFFVALSMWASFVGAFAGAGAVLSKDVLG
jgi:hypothetical protein